MDMQDKSKMLDKITNYCLFILIFGYMILSIFKVPIEIINIISSITSCILYTTILMRYKLKKGTIHKGLLFLGIICILAQFIGLTSSNRYFGILSTVFVYIFYIYNQKLLTGKWNKFFIFFGTFVVISSTLSIYFDNKLITGLFLIIEFVIYGKILNQIMYDIGMKRKNKLEKEGFTKEDEQKVSLIRRILFGRTGKLDLSLVEMLTGKDLTKKSKRNNEYR